MTALKLTQIGNSVGVILPKEVLARLKLEKGDTVFVTDAANGVLLTPYDPALDQQLEIGREFMREYRGTFHQLAKWAPHCLSPAGSPSHERSGSLGTRHDLAMDRPARA
jgi:putative addiction module antidote